jgi:hypothetical protein
VSSEPEKPLEFQSRFLLTAIQEAAAVIRAIDTKVAGLFVVLFLPIAKLPQIAAVCREVVMSLSAPFSWLAATAVVAFVICWVMSFFCALRTLLVVDNPSNYVGGTRPSGVYYSGGLFKVSAWDAIVAGRAGTRVDFDQFFESLPKDDLSARRELAFELMKLVFIRTIKIKRASLTYILVYGWVTLGGLIWVWNIVQEPGSRELSIFISSSNP